MYIGMCIFNQYELAQRVSFTLSSWSKWQQTQITRFNFAVSQFFVAGSGACSTCLLPKWKFFVLQVWGSDLYTLQFFVYVFIKLYVLTRGWYFWHFSVALEVKGYLTLRCSLKLAPRVHSIRASFCPLLSVEKGEFIGLSSLSSTEKIWITT